MIVSLVLDYTFSYNDRIFIVNTRVQAFYTDTKTLQGKKPMNEYNFDIVFVLSRKICKLKKKHKCMYYKYIYPIVIFTFYFAQNNCFQILI